MIRLIIIHRYSQISPEPKHITLCYNSRRVAGTLYSNWKHDIIWNQTGTSFCLFHIPEFSVAEYLSSCYSVTVKGDGVIRSDLYNHALIYVLYATLFSTPRDPTLHFINALYTPRWRRCTLCRQTGIFALNVFVQIYHIKHEGIFTSVM